jgi:Flp pilus assembly protein CpaB
MNPLRALFLSLSRMPPALMLLVIIGLAVIVTMATTSKIVEQEKLVDQGVSSSSDGSTLKQLVYSRSAIPLGAKIESAQLVVRRTNDADAWQDAYLSVTEVAGATTKHAIPAHAQIRRVDLE